MKKYTDRITVRLPHDVSQNLRVLSDQLDKKSVSEIIREIIEMNLAHYEFITRWERGEKR